MTGKPENPKTHPKSGFDIAHPSRRGLLLGALGTASGAALLMGTMEQAEAKLPKNAAKYQDKPKGKQDCSTCVHFQPPHSCNLVAGKISPHGWCRFYVHK